MRLAILTNMILPYRLPVFERLLKFQAVEMRIILSKPRECSDPEAIKLLPLQYSKGFNLSFRTVHAAVSSEQSEALPIPLLLFFDLLAFRPDIIVSGEFGLRSLVALAVSRLLRVPLVIWSEEIKESSAGITKSQQCIRRFLIPKTSHFLAWGKSACEYLAEFGIDNRRVSYCAQAVDNAWWSHAAQAFDRPRLRHEIEATGKIFLLVGRHVTRKGFDRFLQAWAALPSNLKNAHTVVMVGGGECTDALKTLAGDLGLSSVSFVGPQHGENLAKFYAMADVFVMPSLVDVWGLVVNEALACGLPVLGSRYAGAIQEFSCMAGAEGVVESFDPLDRDAFTACLARWCDADTTGKADAARALVAGLNFDVTVAAFRSLIERYTGMPLLEENPDKAAIE